MDNILESSSSFLVSVCGQIKCAHFFGIDNIYCKYAFSYGNDWSLASGSEDGISQVSKKSDSDGSDRFVWNVPIEVAFNSTNAFGWPQLVLSVYGLDAVGNDVVRGYGCAHIPPIPGVHHKRIAMFVPQSSSLLHRLMSVLSGRAPEFVDSRLVAQSEGREVITVTSDGFVDVSLGVILKDFAKSGFRSH